MIITLKEAVEMIEAIPNGQVFTVEFLKRTPDKATGERQIRKMNCRKGVSKGVKGIGRNFNPRDKGCFGVFDMKIAQRVKKLQKAGVEVKDIGHRLISIEGIRSIATNKQRYEVAA